MFAIPFYTDYTVPTIGPPPAPTVTITGATPNPLTATDAQLDVAWHCDQDGPFDVFVGLGTVAIGTTTANTTVHTLISRSLFGIGPNTVSVRVINANGRDTAAVNVTKGEELIPALCWAAPMNFDGPREDLNGDPIANTLGRHMIQPQRASNLFILKSGKVVAEWATPDDPIRVALFGGTVHPKLTPADALLLSTAGFGDLLIACPDTVLGFGLDPFGISSFGGV